MLTACDFVFSFVHSLFRWFLRLVVLCLSGCSTAGHANPAIGSGAKLMGPMAARCPGSCRRQSGGSHCERSEIRRGFGGGLGPGPHRILRPEPLLRHQFSEIFSGGIFGLPQGDLGR